jgi:hypothetical protein
MHVSSVAVDVTMAVSPAVFPVHAGTPEGVLARTCTSIT